MGGRTTQTTLKHYPEPIIQIRRRLRIMMKVINYAKEMRQRHTTTHTPAQTDAIGRRGALYILRKWKRGSLRALNYWSVKTVLKEGGIYTSCRTTQYYKVWSGSRGYCYSGEEDKDKEKRLWQPRWKKRNLKRDTQEITHKMKTKDW